MRGRRYYGSKFTLVCILFLFCSVGFVSFYQNISSIHENSQNDLTSKSALGTIPIEFGFIKNKGQLANDAIEFYYTQSNHHIAFHPSEIVFLDDTTTGSTINFSMTFRNSNNVLPVGLGLTDIHLNFFIGDLFLSKVPMYSEIWYFDIYDGIDLRYYFTDNGVKYEFIVQPGINPNQIVQEISTSIQIKIRDSSVLGYSVTDSNLPCYHDTGLMTYQDTGLIVPSKFAPTKFGSNTYGFQLGKYDSRNRLIIDPWIVDFSSYLGGSEDEHPMRSDVDSDGNIYTACSAGSGFPMKNAYQDTFSGGYYDVAVSKFSSSGDLIFSTYFGGSDYEFLRDIAVDDSGNCYVIGHTRSIDFPTIDALDDTLSGEYDIFLFKLDSEGVPVFSTYFGGSDNEWGTAVDVDNDGNVYFCGTTYSDDYPIMNAFQDEYIPGSYNGDCYVTKLTTNGTDIVYSTYIGGSWLDEGHDIAVDAFNNSYVVGKANSIDFPTTSGAFDESYNGDGEAFLLKLNATGNGLVYCTFLGGTHHEEADGVAISSDGSCFVTGFTDSSDFPTTLGAYQSTNMSSLPRTDAFITKFTPDGASLNFSTYLGGSASDYGSAIAIDDLGNCYISGVTMSDDYPVTYTGNTIQAESGDIGAIISILDATGSELLVSTVIAGAWSTVSVNVDDEGRIYLSGLAEDENLYTLNAFQPNLVSVDDGFLMCIRFENGPPDIILTSHNNNSILPPSTLLKFSIQDDTGLSDVLYNWNEGGNNSLASPYNLLLPNEDGDYLLYVYANDTTGQWQSEHFCFTVSEDVPSSTTTTTSTTNTTTTSSFSILTVVIIISIIGVVVVIVIIILWKKR